MRKSMYVLSLMVLNLMCSTAIAQSITTVEGLWRLEDEAGSTQAVDLFGISDGIVHGGVVLGVDGFSVGTTAAKFWDSDEYIEIPHHDNFLIDSGSITLWFRAISTSGRQGILSKDSMDRDTGGHVTIYLDGHHLKVRLQSTTTDYTIKSDTDLSKNTWYHVAFVFGEGGMELYLNGVLEKTNSYEGGLGTTSGGPGNYEPIVVGSNSWSSSDLMATPVKEHFHGTIDEVMLLTGRLHPSAIAAMAGVEYQEMLFTDISESSGFDVSAGSGANGIHWGDLDNDGDLDAMITGSSAKLLWNNAAEGTFLNYSLGNMSRQGAIADFDNDGDLDFWNQGLSLWENMGSSSLVNQGSLGMFSPYNNEAVAAIDVDADGRVDVVMCSQNGNWIGYNSDPDISGESSIEFDDTADSSDGLHVHGAYGNGDFCSTADVNNDGYLDLFYHYGGGKLFLSDGDGTYTKTSGGISIHTGEWDKMGSAFGDYDNDGDVDLWISRSDPGHRGYLYRNDGGGVFTEVASAAGITDTGRQRGCAWGDYDNDGDLDLAIARQDNGLIVYRNEGNGTFTVSREFPSVTGATVDVCFVDINNDGNLDLSVSRENGSLVLLRNDIASELYLKVRYVGGQKVNGAGIGVRLELWDSGNTTFIARREVGAARGYGGQNPLWVHFGGVTLSSIYTLRVYDPGSTTPRILSVIPSAVSTVFSAQTVSQFLTVKEGSTRARVVRWLEIGRD